MSTLQDRLRELREEKPEISNADLARLAGVAAPSVTGWFNGSTKVLKWTSAQAVAQAYGVSDKWVATGDGEKFEPHSPRYWEGKPRSALVEFPLEFDPARHTFEDLVPVEKKHFRKIWAVDLGKPPVPEQLWENNRLIFRLPLYAELASNDPLAFICPAHDPSMAPRFHPGEFLLVEPGTDPDIEDDVLVRSTDGVVLLKRLLSKRGGLRLGSYQSEQTVFLAPEEVSWAYYVAHAVPRRRIKNQS